MNLIKSLSLFIFACSISTFATGQKVFNDNQLYGNWNCKHEVDDPNTQMKVKIDYNVNFVRGGKSNGYGTLAFSVPNFPELKYSLTDDSIWKIKEEQLILSSQEIKSVNISYPELDKFLNLNQFIPTNINESVEILKLTESILSVKSESNGGTYDCTKIIAKN